MESTVEQRKHPRLPVNFEGIFSSEGIQNEQVVVLDLSFGGCRVGSTTYVPPDATIQLQIRPQRKAPIYVPSAVVRWVQGSTFGVQFRELPEQESKTLTHLLWSLSRI